MNGDFSWCSLCYSQLGRIKNVYNLICVFFCADTIIFDFLFARVLRYFWEKNVIIWDTSIGRSVGISIQFWGFFWRNSHFFGCTRLRFEKFTMRRNGIVLNTLILLFEIHRKDWSGLACNLFELSKIEFEMWLINDHAFRCEGIFY